MTTQPLFHPATSQTILRFKSDLPQSLLITGQPGVGLTTTAHWLADNNVVEHIEPRDTKGEVTNNGTINVETIRRLYEQTRSVTENRQVIIISHAHRMSSAAHGAFLKLLEEPNSSVYFILSTHLPQRLPATIRSRVQSMQIQPITQEQTAALLETHAVFDPVKRRQLEFIATGLPAEIIKLANNEAYFAEKVKLVGDARKFLEGTSYNRLLITHTYKQDRSKALQLCDTILMLLQRSLQAKPQPTIVAQIEQLLEVREQIAANGNALLQLTKFVV